MQHLSVPHCWFTGVCGKKSVFYIFYGVITPQNGNQSGQKELFTNSGHMTFILQLMWSTVMIHSPVLWCDIIFSCRFSPAWIISASLCLFCYCHEDRVGQDLIPWMVALVLGWEVDLYCSVGVCEATAASAVQAHSRAKLCTVNLMQAWLSGK